MILVDSCVLIDVIEMDKEWADWSQTTLDEWGRRGPVCINPVVYAELSLAFSDPVSLDKTLEIVRVEYKEIPRPALFLAARAHQAYRRRGGARTGVLPDFFIGAHACFLGVPLMTRDPRRFRAAFPGINLITP